MLYFTATFRACFRNPGWDGAGPVNQCLASLQVWKHCAAERIKLTTAKFINAADTNKTSTVFMVSKHLHSLFLSSYCNVAHDYVKTDIAYLSAKVISDMAEFILKAAP